MLKIGQVWGIKEQETSPWADEESPTRVVITELKLGWVRYRFLTGTKLNAMEQSAFSGVYDHRLLRCDKLATEAPDSPTMPDRDKSAELGPCTSWGPDGPPAGFAGKEITPMPLKQPIPVKVAAINWVDGLTFRQLCSAADRYNIPHDEDQWPDDEYPDKTDELRVAVADAMGKVGK